MIQLKKLDIGYQHKKLKTLVFKNINAQFQIGNLIGLIGDNGVGKSTLLQTITGNIKPLSGDVLISSKSIEEYTSQHLSEIISIVNTEKIGGFNLTVWDVVASGRTPYINLFGKLSSNDLSIVDDCLERLNINSLKERLIDELSDGQRQKVMIAKSLAQQTPIIVLDEPTAFLDYNSKHHLFEILKKLCLEENKLIIVSSHDLELMKRYVTQSIYLQQGNAIEIV